MSGADLLQLNLPLSLIATPVWHCFPNGNVHDARWGVWERQGLYTRQGYK